MFFSTYVLGKKGPLAKIWLAAHWDKKLTRSDVKVIDLTQTVVQIVHPAVPIALRTSGELLIGVVRIYALKVKHLLKDATDATLMLRAANVQVVRSKEGGKDSAIAVTMDLIAGKADNVCEADFDDIADILKSGTTTGKNFGPSDGSEVLGTAWFTAEPSQFLEEHVSSQGDDIARIRAEMRAFRPSESTSKSGSSTSTDKPRMSTANIGADVLAVGVGGADIDLGVGNFGIDDIMAQPAMADDPFGLPTEEPVAALAKRKGKAITIDSADTVLSKQVIQDSTVDTSDIVVRMRRGPVTPAEVEAQGAIRAAEQQKIISVQPYSVVPCAALREAFAAAVAGSNAHTMADLEGARGAEEPPAMGGVVEMDPFAAGGGADDLLMDVENVARETIPRRKREREEGFSASALATLEHFRIQLKSATSTSFGESTKRLQRIDAARMFVDLLALTSHGVLQVKQPHPLGEISIKKTANTNAPLPTAIAA